MTIEEAKQKLITYALAQVGYVEGGSNYNKFAQGRTNAYGWDVQCQPWCDVFVDVMFIEVFGLETAAKMTFQKVGAFSALCSASADCYKAAGRWFTSPEPGDQVFFYTGGGINHTGIVVSVSGGVVHTVEGNSSDAVRRNAYAAGSSYIAGYGRPNWSVVAGNSTETAVGGENPAEPEDPKADLCAVGVSLPVLKQGCTGRAVKLMQRLLIDFHGCPCGIWGCDGDWGAATQNAVLHFQSKTGLETDGVCGPKTWKALLEVGS